MSNEIAFLGYQINLVQMENNFARQQAALDAQALEAQFRYYMESNNLSPRSAFLWI
jgi:hypothetical protein